MANDSRRFILAALRHLYTTSCEDLREDASFNSNCDEPEGAGLPVSHAIKQARHILADWYIWPGNMPQERDEINTILYYNTDNKDRIAKVLKSACLRFPMHGEHNGTLTWLTDNCTPDFVDTCWKAYRWECEKYEMNGDEEDDEL